MKETIGERVKRLRMTKGYSQRDFAKLLGVTPQVVYRIENGITIAMKERTAEKIATVLNVSPSYILEGDKIEFPHFEKDVLLFLSNPTNTKDITIFVREKMLERAKRGEIE